MFGDRKHYKTNNCNDDGKLMICKICANTRTHTHKTHMKTIHFIERM